MRDLRADANTQPATRRKSGVWRLLKWTALFAGGGLFLLGVLLVTITVPNLRCEVSPPEISGPEQVARNVAEDHSSPTSSMLTVSSPTSGTQPLLNLDDFPHLSPTMRTLAQAWLDQCAETDRLIEALSDPSQRALALAILMNERKKVGFLLNLPLRWDDQEFEETMRDLSHWPSHQELEENRNYEEYEKLLNVYPEVKIACGQELIQDNTLWTRMAFEFYVQGRHWDSAILTCASADNYNYRDKNGRLRRDCEGMNSWEEEVYCLRQMGTPGWLCLAGRSYQRVFDSRLQDHLQTNKYLFNLRYAGYYPYAIVKQLHDQNSSTQASD
jgi:hypothetical protein